jgi:hypothetical protein
MYTKFVSSLPQHIQRLAQSMTEPLLDMGEHPFFSEYYPAETDKW